MRRKLPSLKQHADQRMRAFVGKINSLYDKVNGRMHKPSQNSTQEELNLIDSMKKLRDKEKKQIPLNGMLEKMSEEL